MSSCYSLLQLAENTTYYTRVHTYTYDGVDESKQQATSTRTRSRNKSRIHTTRRVRLTTPCKHGALSSLLLPSPDSLTLSPLPLLLFFVTTEAAPSCVATAAGNNYWTEVASAASGDEMAPCLAVAVGVCARPPSSFLRGPTGTEARPFRML